MSETKPHIVILLSGKREQLPWLSYIYVGKELERLGCRITYLEVPDGIPADKMEWLQRDPSIDAVLSHNFYFQRKAAVPPSGKRHAMVIEWVDTIYNKISEFLAVDPKKTMLLLADGSQVDFALKVKEHEGFKYVFFLSPSAFCAVPEVNTGVEKKKYDILFFGRLGFEKHDFSSFSFLQRRLAGYFERKAFQPGKLQMHEIVSPVFSRLQKAGLYKHSLFSKDFAGYCWALAHKVRTDRRLFILKELFPLKGTRQLVITDHHDRLPSGSIQADIEVLPFQTWPGIQDFMRDSKIVVSIMPFHLYAVHERLLTAMTLGCVVFSDRTPLLEELFRDGEDIVFFDYRKGDLGEKIHHYLAHPEKLRKIAENAARKMMEGHQPSHRAKAILRLLAEANGRA